jgi:hypothetical protein
MIFKEGQQGAEKNASVHALYWVLCTALCTALCTLHCTGHWVSSAQCPCTALHCTALHCTALHCNALHWVSSAQCPCIRDFVFMGGAAPLLCPNSPLLEELPPHCTALHCRAPHCTTRNLCFELCIEPEGLSLDCLTAPLLVVTQTQWAPSMAATAPIHM